MRMKTLGAGLALSIFTAGAPIVAASASGPGNSGSHAPIYYLALGDSLSVGYQPPPAGAPGPTNAGYTNDVYALYHASLPNLNLVEMGCPGESTTTMIHGGICPYERGSQLASAVSFLHAHGKFTPLVTIDIGANNVDNCVSGATIDLACIDTGFAAAAADLPLVLKALHGASPSTRIVGMNYYDPYLAAWFAEGGTFGPLSGGSLALTASFNDELEGIYAAFGVPVADVESAFSTFITTGTPVVPLDVATICGFTWMCTAVPPNIHANAAGYAVMAGAFDAQVGVLTA